MTRPNRITNPRRNLQAASLSKETNADTRSNILRQSPAAAARRPPREETLPKLANADKPARAKLENRENQTEPTQA